MMKRRRLPHIYSSETPLFLTWNLHGSIPSARYPPPGRLSSGQAFVWMDRYLDTVRNGPLWLRQTEIAMAVVACVRKGIELQHYRLHAYVVMPNHVHLLITPLIDPSLLLKSLKGASARESNRLLGRTGTPFWQKESYDHWVRNQQEFDRIRAYIEENPVKAGLVARAEQYPWSSAGVETSLDAARTSACATRES